MLHTKNEDLKDDKKNLQDHEHREEKETLERNNSLWWAKIYR